MLKKKDLMLLNHTHLILKEHKDIKLTAIAYPVLNKFYYILTEGFNELYNGSDLDKAIEVYNWTID